MNNIAKRIRETRELLGFTQEDLAQKAQVNLRAIQRLENGENEPRGKILTLICETLEIDPMQLTMTESGIQNPVGTKRINFLFLGILNVILISITGFLTLDSTVTYHGVLAGFLLSFFIPIFIVFFTQRMSGYERLLKFGSGYILYFMATVILAGFIVGFLSGLFLCLLISVSTLFYGDKLLKI